jgi:AAA family ATP:ADP antiporter
MIYVNAIGIMIIILHFWINKYVLTDKRLYDPDKIKKVANTKTKLSLMEGFKYVAKSKYLRSLAIMVICYGLTINLIEITWKANLKIQYPNPGNYQSFMASLSCAVGFVSFFLAFFAGSNIIRFLGWKKSASACPTIIGATGIIFLILVLNQKYISNFINISPLILIVMFGALQNITTKALKYSIFDPTKEMAFIPLDQESKVKGKAAIDVVGSRLGKSGSAWIQIILIEVVGTGSILSITPLLLPIVFFAIILWKRAINSIDNQQIPEKQFEELPSS